MANHVPDCSKSCSKDRGKGRNGPNYKSVVIDLKTPKESQFDSSDSDDYRPKYASFPQILVR